ncbi:MAG TPA: CsbD family protein [Thermoanaerobaculia bacterium]|nr:CsbD family protein [Thermoanaerobaculia bacterium]
MPNSEELAGKGRKAVGEVKETIGRAVGNRDLEEQGAAEKTAGSFQAGVGKVARKINEVADDVVDDLKKP